MKSLQKGWNEFSNFKFFCFQNEKRKMLMEHETQKLKELDEGYAQELKEWKLQLKPRKQVSKKSCLEFDLLTTLVEDFIKCPKSGCLKSKLV